MKITKQKFVHGKLKNKGHKLAALQEVIVDSNNAKFVKLTEASKDGHETNCELHNETEHLKHQCLKCISDKIMHEKSKTMNEASKVEIVRSTRRIENLQEIDNTIAAEEAVDDKHELPAVCEALSFHGNVNLC